MKGVVFLSHKNNIMVCVTQQKTCERLIKQAHEMIENSSGNLFVVHVVKNDSKFLGNDKEGEALEYLFGISKSVGANLSVLRSDSVSQTLVDYAFENNINTVVMGGSADSSSENKFYIKLSEKLPNINIVVVPQNEF
jgi:Osmosensitive K+ channel histidine kinase